VIIKQFIESIKYNLTDISISTYGCRVFCYYSQVIQKAIEILGDNSAFCELLVSEVNKNALRFIMDHNSNHIV
jgi:hypothetical protein